MTKIITSPTQYWNSFFIRVMRGISLFFCALFFCVTSFSFSQTIEEKIDYTYSNFNAGNYYNSSKHLKEIENYLISQKYEFEGVIDFYDLSIESFVQTKDYTKAIEFAKNKKSYILQKQIIPTKDSLLLSSEITLFHLSQLNLSRDEQSIYLEKILEISKNKKGYFLDVFNYYYNLKIEIYKEDNNYLEEIKLLKALESYNLGYYKENAFEMIELYINLGINYTEISNFEHAENYFQKSLSILKNFESEYSYFGIQTYIALGSLNRRIGNYDLALEYYEKAELNGEKTFNEKPLLLSHLLQNKANLLSRYDNFEKFPEIISNYLKTIEIRRKVLGENHSEYAKALINLGNFYIETGDYKRAETYIKIGEEILKINYGESFIGLTSAKYGLYEIVFDLDDFQQAFQLLKDEISLYNFNHLENTEEFAVAISNLARFYWAIRDYKNAILEFENCINLYVKLFSKEHQFVIHEKQSLARLYREIGNISKAKEIMHSIALIDSTSINYRFENYFDCKNYLFDLSKIQGNYNSNYQEQLSLLKKVEKSDLKETERHSLLLKKLAVTEIEEGKIENALKKLWKANSITIKQFGINHTKVAESFQLLSQVYLNLGQLDSAEYYLKKAYNIKIDVYGNKNPNTSDVVKGLAHLELKKGNTEKGDSLFKDFIEIEEDNFLKTYLVLNDKGMLEYKSNIEKSARHYLDSRIPNNTQINGGKIIELCESWQGINGINYSFNARLKHLVEESKDTLVINTYKAIKLEMAKRAKCVELTLESRKNLNYNIDSIDISIQLLERKLYNALGIEFSKISQITNEAVHALLDSNSIYIQISEINSNEGQFLFTVFRNSSVNPFILKTKIDINEISGIRQSDKNDNEQLYDLLWKHLGSYTNGIKRIYISSEGIYSQINISSLYNSENNKYLFDQNELILYDNLRNFVSKEKKATNLSLKKTSALFGFPNFDGNTTVSLDTLDLLASMRNLNSFWLDSLTREGMKAKPLPGSKTEVENISTTLKSNGWQVTSFIADNASETNIKKQKNPRIFHVATHGYFFENIPVEKNNNHFLGMDRQQVIQDPMLRSGLLLTGANKTLKGETVTGENGLLTAAEASLLDLRGTELVVLSACETGKGEVKNSEGVYGLRKAFSDAGAQNIIMSLWKVDDKITQEFMSRFYEIWLNEKSSIRLAFNKTQLEIKAKYSQPYHWAAFILVGE